MKINYRNDHGFSLIELMISVAIVGILGTMAAASYDVMRMRAQLAGAKQNLAALYAYEKAFHEEYSSYTTRFDALGYQMEGLQYFSLGFHASFSPPAPAPQGRASCRLSCPMPDCSFTPAWACGPATTGVDAAFISRASTNSFLAEAHGHLDAISGLLRENAFTLTIDSEKNLRSHYPAN